MFSIARESMEVLLFAYGLSFFSLGVSVLFLHSKDSEYFYANKIWILGVFAITHAFEDWISLFMYIHDNEVFTSLVTIQSILLLASYVCLFEFSRFIIKKSLFEMRLKKHIFYKLYSPLATYTISSVGLLFLIYLHPDQNGINAAIRYTYGFWGAIVLGIGLYYYGETIKKTQHINAIKLYFKISGVAFISYAVFSGLVVEKISYFPGNIVNTETFFNTFHIPVQVFRAICAVTISIASIKTLDIFRFELIDRLNKSYENIKKFSSNASHQIKTPLTALRLQIHLALTKSSSFRDFRESLNSIDKELIDIQDMVNNLLLLTSMDNMDIRKTFKNVDLDSIILEIFEEYSIIAKNKGIKLEIETLEYFTLKGEKTLLKILISNLIDNAIKFTPNNKKVSVYLKNREIIVKDEGVGIDTDKLPIIFDKFYSTNFNEESKGYGLGLSMVQKIAKIHHATISVKSKKLIGTTISVEF